MKKILLLCESESTLPNQLGIQLEAEGFCVDHPQMELAQWLEDVRTAHPDLILMEIIPEQGEHLTPFYHQLRQDTETETIPILLLGSSQTHSNGKPAVHYLLEGLHAGANDYLSFPYEMDELLGKIEAALRLKAPLEKARQMAQQMNQLNDELYQRNLQVEKELYIARQLQQSLLPSPLKVPDEVSDSGPIFTKVHYENDKLRISGIYLPCDALGGDLYDVLTFPDNAIGISITDVSGHGVPAGFVTAIFKTSLYRVTQQTKAPGEVLFHINNELYDIVKTGDYVTNLYMRIELDTMTLTASGAGHPYPFYYNAESGQIQRLQENGTPLVWVRDIDYPQESVQLHPGDKLFLFTDGVSELKNPQKELYGEDRIEALMALAIQNQDPFLLDTLIENLSDYTEGSPLEDDISMVLIEVL